MEPGTRNGSIRLDIWLDVACLFKTRSEAKRACEGGKVDVNGLHAKPNRLVREGDRIRISRGGGRFQDVIVRILLDTHVRKSEARALYDDVTPKPTPQETEMRRQERIYRAAAAAAGTPDRRRRRQIRQFKEGA
jgi:ribosome-associated heat shock protein Hsp15